MRQHVDTGSERFKRLCKKITQIQGAFFWGYSSYSYSGLGITEYTEFQFRKERSQIRKRNTHGGGDLRTRTLSIQSKPYSFHSIHSAIGSRMNGMIFRSFRKRNSSQKNTNTVNSEYSYSGIIPKERAHSMKLL